MINVSFVVIAYNEARVIARCLDSILAQKDLGDYELIVVDDGSKDETAKIVTEYVKKNASIKLHSLGTNQGRGAARALGINAAVGQYLAMVDADIILPVHWLGTCMGYMGQYDAVSGVAVPDGDVSYVYAKFDLEPKIVRHSTTITGSNGLYKRAVFDVLNFDARFRDGEDVAFNHLMETNGFKNHSISSLIVAHKEAKTFLQSRRWLYQSGLGASRQLRQYRKMRLPDFAFFGFLAVTSVSVIVSFFYRGYYLMVPFLYIIFTSIMHLRTKFVFQFRKMVKYIGAILVNSLLLAYYYVGRMAGMLFPASILKPMKKNILICFDFEGKWGMPFQEEYDLVKTTHRLLDVLDRHNAKAVFFVVGKLVEEYPGLIKEMADRGNEIATHGYEHKNLEKLNAAELEEFGTNLLRIENKLEEITGRRPSGFRAPYLMGPRYYSGKLYRLLEKHKYSWVSNRELRFTEELFRPDRLRIPFFWGKNNSFTNLLFVLLNIKALITEKISNKCRILRIVENFQWLINGANPIYRNTLLEVPVYSPLDCDLLGLPNLQSRTSDDWIRYATCCLVGGLKRNGRFYMLNFHDWIIGSSNRIEIMDEVLKQIRKTGEISFVLRPFKLEKK